MNDLARYGVILLSAVIVAACIRRIDLMRSTRNRPSWWLIHVLIAAHALGEGLDMLRGGHSNWYDTAGLAGVWLYLWESRRSWVSRPPRETEHDALRHADGRPYD